MYKPGLIILLVFISILFEVQADNNQNVKEEKQAESFKKMNFTGQGFKELGFTEVGNAKFTFLFWDIYHSTLYTKSGSYIPENPPAELIFEIEYLKDITAADLLERTIEQWQHLGFSKAQYNQFIPKLKAIWPDIYSGDKLALSVQNNKSMFYFNDVQVGVIEQAEFSQLFLAIWLSKKTSEPELRAELLGENIHE